MGILRLLRGPVRAVGEAVFPVSCWGGGEGDVEGGLSEGARMSLGMLAAQGYCRHCGLTTGKFAVNDFRSPCGRCAQREVGVQRMARVGTFSEPLVTLVHRLKFGRSWEVAGLLAPFLQRAILQVAQEGRVTVDVLVPVPLHWMRRARRGFNQAEELARAAARLGRKSGARPDAWEVRTVLRRVKRTVEQARLDAPTRRKENLRGAFLCRNGKAIAGKHVWIVDDVSTTGATIHAAATAIRKLPREMWPASINGAAVCVTDHGSPPALTEVVET
jgi:ComF family protein